MERTTPLTESCLQLHASNTKSYCQLGNHARMWLSHWNASVNLALSRNPSACERFPTKSLRVRSSQHLTMNNYCSSTSESLIEDLSYARQFGCHLGTIKLYFKHIQLDFDFGMWRNGLPVRLAIVKPHVSAIHVLLDHYGHSNWNVRDGGILHLVSTVSEPSGSHRPCE